MINAWWLLLIIPFSASLGFFAFALCAVGAKRPPPFPDDYDDIK